MIRFSFFPGASKFLFLLLFIVISWYYNIHEVLFLKPQSAHFWRQTDCLSIALNYFEEGRSFFKPSVHYIGYRDNGQTVSDFPVFYYIIGNVWNLTGQNEFVYRGFIFLLFFLGLFSLFRFSEIILKDSVWAIVVSLLFYTSPVLAYYGSSFLMNSPAFSLVLIGWLFLLKFYLSRKNQWLWLASILFALAGLLKITALISFIGVAGIFVLEWSGLVRFKEEGKIFENPRKQIMPFVFVFFLIFAWVTYARYYNKINNSDLFLVGIAPVWELTREKALTKFHDFFSFWVKHKFAVSTQIVAIFFWICVLIFPKKNNRVLYYLNVVLPLGFLGFIILFGRVLVGHDYYWINLFIVMVFVFLGFVFLLRKRMPEIFRWGKWAFFVFLVYNVFYCQQNLKDRYEGMFNEYYHDYMESFASIEPFNRSLGINRNDRVISLPDLTINGSLYLMDQKGWTAYSANITTDDYYENRIERGAKYLFISDSTLFKEDFIQPYIQNKIGQYKSVSVFKLPAPAD